VTSSGSTTIQWIEENFISEYDSYLSQTAYVTGNPNSVRGFPYEYPNECECGATLEPSYDSRYHNGHTVCPDCGTQIKGDRQVPVQILDEVWRDAWDNDIGTIRPRPITDSAIRTARQDNPNKMIVHYMQPHHPFISAPDLDSGSYIAEGDKYREKQSKTIWEKLENGQVSKDTVWAEYRNNLRIVLEDVKNLLENVDFDRAVITSDHGNAIGEYGLYGHPGNVPVDCLVEVPWYETNAVDEETHKPSKQSEDQLTSEQIKSRLRSLGYYE
jgi:hypothetical protein